MVTGRFGIMIRVTGFDALVLKSDAVKKDKPRRLISSQVRIREHSGHGQSSIFEIISQAYRGTTVVLLESYWSSTGTRAG